MNNLLAQGVQIGTEFQVGTGKGIGTNWFATPGDLVTVLVRNAYMVSGLILFGLLIFGGLTYIINVGSGDSKKVAQGTKAISSALIGFLVVFASYWIIQIIQAIFSIQILIQLYDQLISFSIFRQSRFTPWVDKYGDYNTGLVALLNNLLKLTVVIAGLFTLFNIIFAGYAFFSAGGDSKKISEATAKIWQSIIGLVIVAGSFMLAAIVGLLIFKNAGAIINPQIYTP